MTTVFPGTNQRSRELLLWVDAAVGNPMNERLLVAVGAPRGPFRSQPTPAVSRMSGIQLGASESGLAASTRSGCLAMLVPPVSIQSGVG
jgi:hypothetical protein